MNAQLVDCKWFFWAAKRCKDAGTATGATQQQGQAATEGLFSTVLFNTPALSPRQDNNMQGKRGLARTATCKGQKTMRFTRNLGLRDTQRIVLDLGLGELQDDNSSALLRPSKDQSVSGATTSVLFPVEP